MTIHYPVNSTKTPPVALFHVPPKMTKFEVKEYLTKIYNMDVVKVTTSIMLGEYMQVFISIYKHDRYNDERQMETHTE